MVQFVMEIKKGAALVTLGPGSSIIDQEYQIYTVQPGDTLYKIALKFDLSLSSLIASNLGGDPNQLIIGQPIRIPRPGPKPELTRSIAGWIPYWIQTQSLRSVQNQPDMFHNLSPFWYEVTTLGGILKYPGSEDLTTLAFARTQGIRMVPLITNAFSSEQISTVLNDPIIRQNHVVNITRLLSELNYDGIDINYENLFVKDKEVFVVFHQQVRS